MKMVANTGVCVRGLTSPKTGRHRSIAHARVFA